MAGNPVSKTGLIASPKKRLNRVQKSYDELHLSKCAYARPVQFSLRPFGGLFNPYAKGCSILCNHPGPNEVKTVVRQAKDAWISEGKGLLPRSSDDHYGMDGIDAADEADLPDHIPEEFFRRYAGSDSRPMTPTPTVASGRTRTSTGSHVNTRRCFTPDLINSGAKERKQIILDLRRSHSQETMYWNASSELSPAVNDPLLKSGGKTANKSLKPIEQSLRSKSAEKKSVPDGTSSKPSSASETTAAAIVCANDQEEVEDEEDVPRRRGKRKKKASKLQTTSTFQVSQEPETQIATLGPDSPNQSNRPSLIPNGNNIPRLSLMNTANQTTGGRAGGTTEACRQSSFISEEALKYLRRGLNIDVVENSFDRYMNKALKVALRTIPVDKMNSDSEALRKFKESMPVTTVDNERWLSMPRKYTRNSARFTLPINTHDLAIITPFQYVSRHIWISDYRKQLCHFVFKKFLPEISEQDAAKAAKAEALNDPAEQAAKLAMVDKERTISFLDLQAAMRDVLGFHGTDERINEIKAMLQLTPAEHGQLNFREWCGVVAFGERYLNSLSHEEDPCDEIEIADFESLERKFSYVDVSDALKMVLNMIKNK